jgi:TonB family protein
MNTAPHSFDPEIIMSFLDNELAPAQSGAIRAHLTQCAECAALIAKLQETSSVLAMWSIGKTPHNSSLQQQISIAIQQFQRRNSMPLASFFRLVKPRYILVAITLILAVTFWAQQSPSRITLAQEEMQAKLIKQSSPSPQYPQEAKDENMQGIVKLQAIVGKDGSVKKLTVISGNPLLVTSSLATVQHWKYQPTLVDGKPVEVKTVIEISFTLAD